MSFWSWYADLNDSIRHSVIEQGWYGHNTTQNITAEDMPGLLPEPEEEIEPTEEIELEQ